MSVENLVNAIINDDTSSIEQTLNMAMAEKLAGQLSDMRQDIAQSLFKEQSHIDEVLGKSDAAEKWIKDFVHSDDPKFAGKSKKQRIKQALAAYYAKQRD